MERIQILAIFVLTGLLLAFSAVDLSAQTDLERISIAERSDGKGFVVRYHLSEPADSFKIAQPAPDLVQFMIYSPGLEPSDFITPDDVDAIQNLEYHNNKSGFGTDIIIEQGNYFISRAYKDQNGTHLLVALERSTPAEAETFSSNHDFIYWFDYLENTETAFELPFYDGDDTFLRLRNGENINVIVLDPGHGGRDPGAINRQLGIREKDVALAVALKVGEYINQYMPDVEVVYTRKDDRFIELEERGRIASKANGDLFVSIHANSARNVHATGSEVYFLGLARTQSALEAMKRENSVVELEEGGGPMQLSEEELLIYELANAGNMAISERLASMIEDQFRTRAQRRSRGVKQAGFMVLWNLPMPAVLVELGFLSNPDEARYMASDYGQTILASAIFRAIRDFKVENDKHLGHSSTASND
jgi:N-acetylmuramoyl-L-alanine amidase